MRTWTVIATAAMFICSCGAPEVDEEHSLPPDITRPSVVHQGRLCFLNVTRSSDAPAPDRAAMPMVDSLKVELLIDGDRVTGQYDWHPSMKDQLSGPLEGTIRGDTIVAIHRYNAEGTSAIEEKLLLLKGDQLWIANGELVERNGIWALKERTKAVWTQALSRYQCQ